MLVVAIVIVLGSLSFMPAKPALAGSWNAPVLMLHGINTSSTVNCGPTFGTIKSFFNGQYYSTPRSLGYYNWDTNCDDYPWSESYHCTNWYTSGSDNGSVNEDIRHVSCLVAWFIWDHYTQYG